VLFCGSKEIEPGYDSLKSSVVNQEWKVAEESASRHLLRVHSKNWYIISESRRLDAEIET